MRNQSDRHEFRLVLDGIKLDEGHLKSLAEVIQETGREALASLDVSAPDGVSVLIRELGGKSTGHEFKFVLDGIELEDRQQATIATSIQGASLKIVGSLDMWPPEPVVVGTVVRPPDLSWIGLYIADGRMSPQVRELLLNVPKPGF